MSSVTDCYNSYEEKYGIARKILEQLVNADCQLTISTKSTLILRDIELLKRISNLQGWWKWWRIRSYNMPWIRKHFHKSNVWCGTVKAGRVESLSHPEHWYTKTFNTEQETEEGTDFSEDDYMDCLEAVLA